jgi:hypothetical protein
MCQFTKKERIEKGKKFVMFLGVDCMKRKLKQQEFLEDKRTKPMTYIFFCK